MMKSAYLERKFEEIQEAIGKAKQTSLLDVKLASMLSSYLVVFISGIYEDCIENLFVQRAGKSYDGELQNLVRTLINEQFRNPEYGKIKKLVKSLNTSYGNRMDSQINTKYIEGINSIVENKNKVAHGNPSNATLKDVEDYHNRAINVFKVLEDILL